MDAAIAIIIGDIVITALAALSAPAAPVALAVSGEVDPAGEVPQDVGSKFHHYSL